MQNRTIILAVVFFVVIIGGMFTYAYLKNAELSDVEPSEDVTDTKLPDSSYAYITSVDAKHFYIDGVHTLAGEILMPTPCDLLEADVTIAESFPEQITIDFSVINNSEFCAQVATEQRFKVTATASPDALFSATFMGRPIDLNLIPAAEGETPDDFEVFIKG